MAAKLILAPEVEQDLDEAYSWCENRRIGLGEDFFELRQCVHSSHLSNARDDL